MFTLDISITELENILADVKSNGGDTIRFTVYDSTDEVPNSLTTRGLMRPATELNAGEGSFFPNDRT